MRSDPSTAPPRGQEPAGSSTRLPFIDGLRGIAASMVVVFHLAANVSIGSDAFAQSWFAAIARFGYLGVYVFFVISGYVITLSVGNGAVNGSFFWRYALRRAVRLDPPYWLSMLVAIGLAVIAQSLFASLHKELPSAGVVIAHLFYVQNFLQMKNIVAVYWTLCFEIQFYLVLLLILWLSQASAARKTVDAGISTRTFVIVSAALFLFSLGELAGLWHSPVPGLFTHSWYAFCAGAACYLTIRFRWHRAVLMSVIGLVALVAVVKLNLAALSTALTAILIYVACASGAAGRWLSGRVPQYLGRISYSLYLLHPTVGWTAVSVLKKLFGNAQGVGHGVLLIVCGCAVSVLAADLAYRLVEKPSIRLSHLIKLRKEARGFAPSPAVP